MSNYQIVQLGKDVQPDDEVVLAVNGRMAYIYTLDRAKVSLNEIVDIMKQDERMDVIGFQNGEMITVTSSIHEGELHFHPEGDVVDSYGQSWSMDGNHDILDIDISDNKIAYGDYPDGLARLYTSLVSHEGNYLVVTAKLGHEFKGECSPIHVGSGSHSGLHKQESSVAMVVCGTSSTPKYLRTIVSRTGLNSWSTMMKPMMTINNPAGKPTHFIFDTKKEQAQIESL